MQQHVVVIPSFQEKPVLLVAAMGPVADDGMKDMCQVLPDLVHAAGHRPYFQQRIA